MIYRSKGSKLFLRCSALRASGPIPPGLNRNRHRRKKRGNPEPSEAGFLSAVQLELLFLVGYQQDLAIMKRVAEHRPSAFDPPLCPVLPYQLPVLVLAAPRFQFYVNSGTNSMGFDNLQGCIDQSYRNSLESQSIRRVQCGFLILNARDSTASSSES
jgi:hypothetical protein